MYQKLNNQIYHMNWIIETERRCYFLCLPANYKLVMSASEQLKFVDKHIVLLVVGPAKWNTNERKLLDFNVLLSAFLYNTNQIENI